MRLQSARAGSRSVRFLGYAPVGNLHLVREFLLQPRNHLIAEGLAIRDAQVPARVRVRVHDEVIVQDEVLVTFLRRQVRLLARTCAVGRNLELWHVARRGTERSGERQSQTAPPKQPAAVRGKPAVELVFHACFTEIDRVCAVFPTFGPSCLFLSSEKASADETLIRHGRQ